jgi:N-acetyl-anhydromuramyl-L-alanine amidase AmpD
MTKKKRTLVIAGASLATLLVVCVSWTEFRTHRFHIRQAPPPQYTIVLDNLYPFVHSPNFNSRPDGEVVDCIVLHATGENTRQGVVDAFLDTREHRSAHYVVARDGSVTQMVPVEMRAWHAGRSALDGVTEVNNYSIGIEMVNRNTGYERYTKQQYASVAKLIDQIRCIYTIPQNRIVSHASVALPPGRKNDPDGFNFDRLFIKMNQLEPAVQAQMSQKIAQAKQTQKLAQAMP